MDLARLLLHMGADASVRAKGSDKSILEDATADMKAVFQTCLVQAVTTSQYAHHASRNCFTS